MSKQFNYFANEFDLQFLISEILNSTESSIIAIPERGKAEDYKFDKFDKLIKDKYNHLYFTTEAYREFVIYRNISDNMQRIDPNNSPVIELIKSIELDDKTIKVGRIMIFNDENKEINKIYNKIIRKLKMQTVKLSIDNNFYAFKNTILNAYKFQFWVGKSIDNEFNKQL